MNISIAEYRKLTNTTDELILPDSFSNPTEAHECRTLTDWLEIQHRAGKVVKYAHLVNELKIDRGHGQKPNFAFLQSRKAEGWKPGVPDYVVVLKNKVLFIEMKRKKGNKPNPEQLEWIKAINNAGIQAVVCYGAKEAIDYVSKQF